MNENVHWKTNLQQKSSDRTGRLIFIVLYAGGIFTSFGYFGTLNEDGSPKSTLQIVVISLLGIYCAIKLITTIFESNTYVGDTVITSDGIKAHQHHCRNFFSKFEKHELNIPWQDVENVRFSFISVTDSALPGLIITLKDGHSPWSTELPRIYDTEKLARDDLAVIERLRSSATLTSVQIPT